MSVLAKVWDAIEAELSFPGPWTFDDFPSFLASASPFAKQLQNFLNITACQLVTDERPECKGVEKVVGLTPDELREWERASWIMSIDRKDKDAVMECPPNWDCNDLHRIASYGGTQTWKYGEKVPSGYMNWYFTYHQWNVAIMSAYMVVVLRLEDLWPGHSAELWPYFYYIYTTDYGKLLVDSYIDSNADMPSACAAALRSNDQDQTQRLYGLLNMPDMWSIFQAWDWAVELLGTVNPAQARERLKAEIMMHTIAETGAFDRLGHPLWTPAQRKVAYEQLLFPANAARPNWDDTLMKNYWQFYLNYQWFHVPDPTKPPSSTNPPTPVQDPSMQAGKPNPYDIAGYRGMLPYAPKPKLAHQRIGGSGDTKDPNAKPVCVPHKGLLEETIPVIGAVIGGAVGLIFMPGRISKVSAAVTLGGFGFFYLSNAYGWDAFQAWYYGTDTSGGTAAQILSVGAPVTGITFLYDLELVPEALDIGEVWVAAGAGVLGYVMLFPILSPVLSITGSLSTVLTAPIAFLERVVEAFTSGCVEAMVSGDCLCENASVKDKLAESILVDIYGVTDDQLTMRRACMRHQMTLGDWGSDPQHIGTCDPTTHNQTNPMACLPSTEYTDYNMDPKNTLAWGMYQQIKPCLDPDNPVFLPARDVDKQCASQGPHFRFIDGQCIDFSVDANTHQ